MMRPMNATVTATMVAHERLAEGDTGSSTATSGVIELRKAALAGVVLGLQHARRSTQALPRAGEEHHRSGAEGCPRLPAGVERSATASMTSTMAIDR